MSYSFSMKVDPAQIEAITKRLDGLYYKSPTVMKNAANRVSKEAVKMMDKEWSDKYAYSKGTTMADVLHRKSATYANPRAIISARTNMEELIDFDVSHRYPLYWTDPASWVRGRVLTDSPFRHVMKYGNKAFIAEFKSGHASVVARVGEGRKIRSLSAPSFSHMAGTTYEEIEDSVNEMLIKETDKEIEKVLGRING